MAGSDANLRRWQRRYYTLGAAIAPVAPMLALQGQITRWKVGLLPDASGPREGLATPSDSGTPDSQTPDSLFVLGESTVAGLGARDHEHALAGQFALNLSEYLQRPIHWRVLGKNGVTARRTIEELLPQMPSAEETPFDYILLGVGGNDVMRLSSPVKWRRDMLELLRLVRAAQPDAVIFISNCPMIVLSPVIPEPSKSLLWQLSRMHDENIKEFTRDLDRIVYYPQPVGVRLEGFFADGIHPSEQGYADWAKAMVDYFATRRDKW
ncbi:MAG TPA: SGNH/GDSL hydrolase family protein [Pyrinomonadaceae bacterium]|nr:SGNH/GDSL hydrolase family protein [Pyrinomonadaceae bacterium]